MKVKICGICRPEDASVAVEAGADYVGVILGASSPRLRGRSEAAEIFASAGGAVRVGVFADAPSAEIRTAVDALGLGVVQLHGSESPSELRSLHDIGALLWKAVRARTGGELLDAVAAYRAVADGLLVDGWSVVGQGGVGARAPWPLLAPLRDRIPRDLLFVLAGGLTADNVGEAVAALTPDIVDVSSGVERVIGEKSAERIRAFVAAARGVRATTDSPA